MAETRLITINDIREFWPMDQNLNNDRLLMHVLRAQQNDLKPFLGDEFYFAFMENKTAARFVTLFDGGQFTYQTKLVYFSGVRQLLTSYTYARLFIANPNFLSRGGNVLKLTDQSESMEQVQIDGRGREALSDAIRIQNEVWQFLDQNRSIYPEWDQNTASFNDPKRSAFRLTKLRPTKILQRGASDADMPRSTGNFDSSGTRGGRDSRGF